MGVIEVWEHGYPFIIAKYVVDSIDKIDKYGLMRLASKVETISDLKRLFGDRLGYRFSFSPDYWYDPGTWGFALSHKTLEYVFGSTRFYMYPYSEETQKRFYAYQSIGLCVVEERDDVYGNAIPIAFLFPENSKPREIAVFKRKGTTIHIYTAHPLALDIIKKYGFSTVSSYEHVKRYVDEDDMYRELSVMDEELRRRGIDTFMLMGLRDEVKEYQRRLAVLA